MKYKVFAFALVVATSFFVLMDEPVDAASSSLPCHECESRWVTCNDRVVRYYEDCLWIGSVPEAICDARLENDLNFCGDVLESCLADCFECE